MAGCPPRSRPATYRSEPETQMTVATSVQRDVCYNTGCYHLQGDGVTVPYQWVWWVHDRCAYSAPS